MTTKDVLNFDAQISLKMCKTSRVSLQVKLQVPFRLEIGDQTIEEVNSIMRKKSVIIKGKKMALHGEPVEPKQILEFIQHFNLSNLNLSTFF